ncbi:hypothetical protein MTBBW1_750054 [Desulfamplus magnetovallimortis]|uniref:Uncharacterized protein n=1 Tax=Desulfamplus magnetovallimortis TaxID=1246637 RepID=A0A1W1HJA5_9BACT|nr:hypothetical protein MTBBW1_750054 [Desulfamplus magnetovallimortis]
MEKSNKMSILRIIKSNKDIYPEYPVNPGYPIQTSTINKRSWPAFSHPRIWKFVSISTVKIKIYIHFYVNTTIQGVKSNDKNTCKSPYS